MTENQLKINWDISTFLKFGPNISCDIITIPNYTIYHRDFLIPTKEHDIKRVEDTYQKGDNQRGRLVHLYTGHRKQCQSPSLLLQLHEYQQQQQWQK